MKQKQEPALASDEAERGVLGRLIVDDRHFYEYSSRLRDEDFASARHRAVYGAIRKLVERGIQVSRPALIAEIGSGDVETPAYVSALVAGAAQAAELGGLVDLVTHYAGRRRIIAAADVVKDKAQKADPSISLEEIQQNAISLIENADDSSNDDGEKFSDIVASVIQDADQIIKTGKPIGIKSGLKAFDSLVGPILPGQLIVVGGETGSGKTALVTQLICQIAAQGIPLRFASLEMGKKEIGARVLGAKSNISSDRIQEGNLTPAELDHLFNSTGMDLLDLPIWIDDSPKQSVATMQARFARAKIKHGIKVGAIDHLQFMNPENQAQKENERVASLVNGVKASAKRLGIPLILVSHVSRKIDWRFLHTAGDISRPVLSDLYGSSAIEKAADVVIFVHRPIYFLERASPPDDKREQWQVDKIRWQGRAELVMPKRRAGKGFGVTQCYFDETRTWFSDERQEGNAGVSKGTFHTEPISGHDYGPAPWDH